jgi:alkanesulfonate monooxygenase SsuD/methylene tetrahydromethanopterin reductase-like flavin-dependent oxidoreductase (luciferase family)
MSAVFAHHMSPDLAFEALRQYRREFQPRADGDTPCSAISVLAFASEDDDARREFVAAWTLTLRNLAQGVREPLRPEQVQEFTRSAEGRASQADDTRMVTGPAKVVVERLQEMQELAAADELVLVTPGLDRRRRADSFVAIADAWRQAS